MKIRSKLLGSILRELPRLLASMAIVLLSGILAYQLRFDFQLPPHLFAEALRTTFLWLAIQPIALWLSGWHRVGWRTISLIDTRILGKSVGLAALLSSTGVLLVQGTSTPRSVLLMQGAMLFGFSVLLRIGVRTVMERVAEAATLPPLKCVLIYGAGSAGQALLRELRRKPEIGYAPVGFVDDDPALESQIILGLPVLGNGSSLASLVQRHAVDEILVAFPSAGREILTHVVAFCDQSGRPCKSIPSIADLVRAPQCLTDLKTINLEDLLGRKPVRLDSSAVSRRISGKVVLVTGAAGSIGSEICRQVSRFQPRRLIAFDIAETPLFELENEFRERFRQCPAVFSIGDVRDEPSLLWMLREWEVDIVFHAAAYKHVPMMERHVAAAISNNVFGTYALANAAEQAGVQDFIMISSDKAVRPASVMGATKRVAEMIVKSRAGARTNFVSVRFGNVLGSNGSVVPIFNRQIQRGGPVTVTHPEMRRYFMTIPEAAQLVLEAMALGSSSEIFVLDMGTPVLISQLAKSLIALHGKIAGRDIDVRYTGLRPGEKLFEELYLGDENLVRTVHKKILVLRGQSVCREQLECQLGYLRDCLQSQPRILREHLRSIVPDYVDSVDPSECHTERANVPQGLVPRAAKLPESPLEVA